jgi:hypothetical protein
VDSESAARGDSPVQKEGGWDLNAASRTLTDSSAGNLCVACWRLCLLFGADSVLEVEVEVEMGWLGFLAVRVMLGSGIARGG